MAHVDVGQNIGVPAPVYVAPAPVYAPPPPSAVNEQRAPTRQRESSRALNWSSAGIETGFGTDIVIGIGAIGTRADITTIAAANFVLGPVKRLGPRPMRQYAVNVEMLGWSTEEYIMKLVGVRSGHSKARQVKRKQLLGTGQLRMRSTS